METRSHEQSRRARKRQHSQELLDPPKGAGVDVLLRELGKDKPTDKPVSGPPKTFRVETSSVLSRLQVFLPQLQQADCELQKRLESDPPGSLDIEAVSEGEAHIQMDLAVVPLPPTSIGDSEESDSSSDSDSDSAGSDMPECQFPLKLSTSSNMRTRGGIEVLAER